MIKILAAALFLLAPLTSAATPLERAAVIASEIGAPIPATPALTLPAPSAKPAATERVSAAASEPLSGYAWLSGTGSLSCSGGSNGSGWMNGWIWISGSVPVSTRDGASGSVKVDGTVFVSGSCHDGQGYVTGSATVRGAGTLYREGKPAGRATLSGSVFVNQWVTGPFVWFSQNVYLNGHFDAAAAQ